MTTDMGPYESFMTADVRARIETLAAPVLAERGLELVELGCHQHSGSWLCRFLVDRVGGVTIQQCAQANQAISQALEGAQVIPGSYTVEVSSPGLDRPLATRRDFERAIGEDVRVEVQEAGAPVRTAQGMLLAVRHEAIVLKTAGGNVTVPLAAIRHAKKALRW